MSDADENPEPWADTRSGPGSELEWVPEDDRIIGRALGLSARILVATGVAVALLWLVLSASDAPPPETPLEAPAPREIERGASPPPIRFTDVTVEAGVDFVHSSGGYGDKLLPETMGGGVALFDVDGDGDSDLLLVDSGRWPFAADRYDADDRAPSGTRLYRNDTAPSAGSRAAWRFTDITAEVGLRTPEGFYGMGVATGDVDGDGDEDVYLTGVGGNVLLRNDPASDGTGRRLVDVTAVSGLAGGSSESGSDWSSCATFFDADADGDLDLFVCNYVRWSPQIDFTLDFRLDGVGRAFGPPQEYEGTFPRFVRNEGVEGDPGDGVGPVARFVDASEEAGIRVVNPATGAPAAKSLAVAPVDADGDGDLDLFVANDTVRNFLFENRMAEEGRFEEIGEIAGLAYDRDGRATGAMGVDAGYPRNDDGLSLVVGNFANEMSSIYVRQPALDDGDPAFFVDEAIAAGIGAPSRRTLTFGLFLFDADLDGRQDLLQVNGHIEEAIGRVDPSQSYLQRPMLFWNAPSGSFVPVAADQVGDLDADLVGRGAAYADLDGDGDLDVVLTQVDGRPLLLRNDQALDHHWLRIRLESDRPVRGARVEVRADVDGDGAVDVQKLLAMPTRSYLSQVETTLTFGLGVATSAESVTVVWPDGTEQPLEIPGVDRVVTARRDLEMQRAR